VKKCVNVIVRGRGS